MDLYTQLLKQRITEYEQENKILWNAVRDIERHACSLEEAKLIARKAEDALDPFLPLMVTHPTEEARKAS